MALQTKTSGVKSREDVFRDEAGSNRDTSVRNLDVPYATKPTHNCRNVKPIFRIERIFSHGGRFVSRQSCDVTGFFCVKRWPIVHYF